MNIDDMLDLEWFFSGAAEAACGVRSSQGGIEAALSARALCGKGEGCMHLHETRGGAHDFDLSDRLSAVSRARAIYQRLGLLDRRDRRVLEMQFGDGAKMGGLGIRLMSAQPSAIKGHEHAVAAASKVLVNRKSGSAIAKLRASKSDNQARQRTKMQRSPGMTVSDFLRWLACHDEATREMLDRITAEAREELDRATSSFSATAKRVA